MKKEWEELEELFRPDGFQEQKEWLERHGFRPYQGRDGTVDRFEYYRENGNMDALRITVRAKAVKRDGALRGEYKWTAAVDKRRTMETPAGYFPEYNYNDCFNERQFDDPRDALLAKADEIRSFMSDMKARDNDGSQFAGCLRISL
ncbi:MAG: hypothetical protein J6Y62_06860 [Clostridia bacterium]|nr:hypothetical protein [Clostridia bacterium]